MIDHFAVQRNLVNTEDVEKIREACRELHVSYTEFTIVPFSGYIPNFRDAFYYGSTKLLTYFENTDSKNLFYDRDSFRASKVSDAYGPNALNRVDVLHDVSKAPHFWHFKLPIFIKPDICTKRFTGRLFTSEELQLWSLPDDTTDWDGKIIRCLPQDLISEWRAWVVDGNVVAGCQYRQDGKLHISREGFGPAIIDIAQNRADIYHPAQAFVLDICSVQDEDGIEVYKVVEVNPIHCSGFYDANVRDIIKALSGRFD